MHERLQKLLMELEKVGMQLRQELRLDGIRLETINKGRILFDKMTIFIDKKIGKPPEGLDVLEDADMIEGIRGDAEQMLRKRIADSLGDEYDVTVKPLD